MGRDRWTDVGWFGWDRCCFTVCGVLDPIELANMTNVFAARGREWILCVVCGCGGAGVSSIRADACV
jgi:hypothetical protein